MMHNLPCETCRGLEKVHVTDQPVTIPFANPNPMGRRPPRAQERRPCFPRLPRLKKRRLVLCRAGGCTPSRDRTSKRDLEASACATCTSRHDFPREMDHGHRVALAQLARSFSGRVYSIGNPSIDQTSLEFLPVTLRYDLQRSGPEFLRCGASVLNSDVDQSPVAKLPSRDCGRSHSALPDVHSYSSRRCILWKSLPLVSSGNGDGACQSLSSDGNRLGSSRGRRCRRSRMLGPVAARVLLITRITYTSLTLRRHFRCSCWNGSAPTG